MTTKQCLKLFDNNFESLSESIVRKSCRCNEVDVIKACHFLALQSILALVIWKNGQLILVI